MKIMHVCKKYPRASGGDAVVVSHLEKEQHAAGHKVVVVTSNCDDIQNAPNVYKFGFKDTPANLDAITPKRIASLVVLFFRIFGILRTERPDVIHTHSIDMAFVVSIAARLYGVPVVHTFHIVTFYDAHHSLLRRKIELWLAKKAQLRAATAPNNYDVNKLHEAGLVQTKLLDNGVDLSFWGEHVSAPEVEDFVFLAVGRLERQKGYEYLIKAASLLAHSLPVAFRVIIAGDGSQKAHLRELIKSQHVEDIVTLVGNKSAKQLRSLYAFTDAAVFPSLYETTPITLLEAWAAGVPVIVSSVGILRDAPKHFDAAYVVPPGDEEVLLDAMGRCIIATQEREHIATRGYEEAARYSWPKIAQTAETIYRSVL